jgi:DNA repair ATPase RecN
MELYTEKFNKYLEIQKELSELRKKQKECKKQLTTLEADIKEYMTQNDMDSISLKDGEIMLYAKKISQTFKRETISEKLAECLNCDEKKAETLADNILKNKKYLVEDKIKAVIKKK